MLVRHLPALLLATLAAAVPACAATLLSHDFEPASSATASPTWPTTAPKTDQTGVSAGPFGTITEAATATPSGGLRLLVDRSPRTGFTAQLQSGPLAVTSTERDLAKITLAFDLSASRALPVRVLITSLDAHHQPTGALETQLYPAASDFYQRYALDLSTLSPTGTGKFDPTAPYWSFTYEIASATGWPTATRHELHLDNVHLATPAYYVSPTGTDTADGRTAATAFATPQHAVSLAQPGDIILLMDGTYSRPDVRAERQPVIDFIRPGAPAAWITLKNHPGHRPTIAAHGQHGIGLTRAELPPTAPADAKPPALAYLEIRGLHIRGDADTAREKYPDEIGKWTPHTNARGINVNPNKTPTPLVHHLRIADNRIEHCVADGIYLDRTDRITVERNEIYDNCTITTSYVPSGLVLMHYANFDLADNVPKFLIRDNRIARNRLTVFNSEKGTKYWNGNGILIDDNATAGFPDAYLGRTLVQNNLVYQNGGGGIQMWGSHRLDIVNNTLYHNGTTPELKWGNLGVEFCQDVRILNNLIVALPDRPLDTWMVARLDTKTSDILRANNLYSGGVAPPVEGINDLLAAPLLIAPGADPATADFRLRPDSPARHAGRWELFTPSADLAGTRRPPSANPDIGALQFTPDSVATPPASPMAVAQSGPAPMIEVDLPLPAPDVPFTQCFPENLAPGHAYLAKWPVGPTYTAETWFSKNFKGRKSCLTTTGEQSFQIEWDMDVYGFLHEVGLYGLSVPADDVRPDAKATFTHELSNITGGGGYTGLYGWFGAAGTPESVELYINENWAGGPINMSDCVRLGAIELDGATYEIYTRPRQGRRFAQWWSNRTTPRTTGEIAYAQHIQAWRRLGLPNLPLTRLTYAFEVKWGVPSSGRVTYSAFRIDYPNTR